MKNVTRTKTMVLAAIFLTIWGALPCCAAESAFKEIFQDALYGGLTGALVGAAVMAFTHKPGDHLNYMGYGGAGGVLAGAAIGMAKTAKSFAEMDGDQIRFAMPTIIPVFQDTNSRGQSPVVIKAELLRGIF